MEGEGAWMGKAEMTLEEAIKCENRTLPRRVLEYSQVMKKILDSAKNNSEFSVASWDPVAALVDVDNFERVGPFKEVVNWKEYAELLTNWAIRSGWDVRVRRITEQGNLVFLELAEFSTHVDVDDSIFSLSVYEFNDDNQIFHLDIYMQREPRPLPSGTWNVDKQMDRTSGATVV
jgi:hypothetical protein